MIEIVERFENRLQEIDRLLAEGASGTDRKAMIELNRERRRVADTLESGRVYRKAKEAIDGAKEIINTSTDPDLITMAKEELALYQPDFEKLENDFRTKLLPRDPDDEKAAIVEIRAGTGGDEAGLFAGDLFRMYQYYAENKGWKLEALNTSPANMGGFKEIIFSLDGEDTYGNMKYESGVHRVQRVPDTETQGRIHTSAVTVAVFPEAEEVDIDIKEKDLKIDVYRSSGPGGQSVNTTDSAVRVTHLPTGVVVTCQDEKSQLKNKTKALKVLRARLFDAKKAEQEAKMAQERRSMVSTGDRSAKIRTYNFPQGRVTDHRIGLTLYQLEDILSGNVDELIQPLRDFDRQKKLEAQALSPAKVK
ncbi:MAG TPA: peptide chain release factor 1 [candidate division Zixibacteria bacterium]|nr:peptide chain release factor 1 [candidate division Zixibacteria bacterium]